MADARAFLALLALRDVGPATIRKVRGRDWRFPLERRGEALPDGLPDRLGRALADPAAVAKANAAAEKAWDKAQALGLAVLAWGDPKYPALLAQTDDAPPVLFVEGEIPEMQALAVIGTRQPTPAGVKTASRIACHFAGRGWSIVSGLAYGIDAAAHRGAIAAPGRTVAVLGHGHDITHPKQHRGLREKILANGGSILSEYPPGTPVTPNQLVKRDRIQAGLSAGVVCVQTGVKGGSLHASRAALHYGRLLVVPRPDPRDENHEKVQGNRRMREDAHRFLGVATGEVFRLDSRDAYGDLEQALLAVLNRLKTRAGVVGGANCAE